MWTALAAVLVAAATWLFGWVAVPIVAAVLGLTMTRARRPVLSVTTGAILGWVALLLRSVLRPRLEAYQDIVAGFFPGGAWGLAGLALVWCLVLAAGGALIGSAVRRTIDRPPR
jgi:hypothetical protein